MGVEVACWAAAMVCVAEAAACLAACFKDKTVRTRLRRSCSPSLAYPAPAVPEEIITVGTEDARHVPAHAS